MTNKARKNREWRKNPIARLLRNPNFRQRRIRDKRLRILKKLAENDNQ
jgi:hypothetical protein